MIRRFGPWPVLALLLSLALPAGPLRADSAESGAQICERAIIAGARRAGLPQDVLHAISLTETGRARGGRLRPYPWAINREGKGFWFQNRDEALAFARASLAEGRRSFDVGCFQINYLWHGANFASLEAMFDPDTGADYAARVPEEPLRRARQLVGGGRRLSFPDPRPRERLSGALRPDHRRPQRRDAAHRRRGRAGGGGCRRRSPRPRGRAGPGSRAGRGSSPSRRSPRPRARRPSRPPPTLRSWRT